MVKLDMEKNIPVFEIDTPEYKIKRLDNLSGKIHRTEFGISIPIEYWDNMPDFSVTADKITEWLRSRFLGKRVGLRFIGSDDHAGKSTDELIDIIKELGHDRYDPDRRGDRYENIDNKKIEVFVLDVEIGKQEGIDGEEQIKHALDSFYIYPIQEKGMPTRVDVCIIYDLDQLISIPHRYEGRENEIKTDGYVFKYPDKKPESILAILKII